MRVGDLQATKQMPVGAKTIGRDTGVSPIVLGAGDAEPIAQAIKLLRIDRMDDEAAIQKHIDDRPMRHLDRDRDRAGLARDRLDPIGQLRQSGAAMRKFAFAYDTTFGIENADLMFLGSPIDSGKPLDGLLGHLSLPARWHTSRHDACRSLYRRSKARLPTGHPSWPTRRGTSPIWCSRHEVDDGRSRQVGPPGQLTQRRAARFPGTGAWDTMDIVSD